MLSVDHARSKSPVRHAIVRVPPWLIRMAQRARSLRTASRRLCVVAGCYQRRAVLLIGRACHSSYRKAKVLKCRGRDCSPDSAVRERLLRHAFIHALRHQRLEKAYPPGSACCMLDGKCDLSVRAGGSVHEFCIRWAWQSSQSQQRKPTSSRGMKKHMRERWQRMCRGYR